jgi:hypothetical protein
MAQITTEMVAGSVAAVLAPNHDASTSIEKVDRGGTYQFSCHDRDMKIVICEKANFGVRDGGVARLERRSAFKRWLDRRCHIFCSEDREA